MRFLFLLFLVLLVIRARAQTVPENSYATHNPAVTPQPFTQADTVRALHNLFKSRRNTGAWLAGSSAGVVAITGVGTLADNNSQSHASYFNPSAGEASLFVGILLLPAWMPGLITLSNFTKKREQFTIAEYQRTKKIPRKLQKKLSAKFFTVDYQIRKSSKHKNK